MGRYLAIGVVACLLGYSTVAHAPGAHLQTFTHYFFWIRGIVSFESAFKKTLNVEGGLSLDPDDSGNWTGGAVGVGDLKGTKYGISAAQYPLEDIHGLDIERAKTIYKRDYWDVLRLDEVLHDAIQEELFDTGVNMGIETAGFILQRTINFLQSDRKIVEDGLIGPQTLRAVNYWCKKDAWALFKVLNGFQFMRYVGIIASNPIKKKFIRSWMQRVQDYS